MADVTIKGNDELAWRRFHPKFMGWNEECEKFDRWYVEIRSRPSRKQALRVRSAFAALATAEETTDDIDPGVGILMQYIKGPSNLTIDGEVVDDLFVLFKLADSVELFNELQTAIEEGTELTEEEEGNSGGQSGGATESAPDVSPETETSEAETSDPADPVSATPGPNGAHGFTIQSPDDDNQSSSTSAPEDGETTRTTP